MALGAEIFSGAGFGGGEGQGGGRFSTVKLREQLMVVAARHLQGLVVDVASAGEQRVDVGAADDAIGSAGGLGSGGECFCKWPVVVLGGRDLGKAMARSWMSSVAEAMSSGSASGWACSSASWVRAHARLVCAAS